MSSLNVARLTNKLRTLFVLRGGPPPAPEVADEIVPVVLIEGERPEHYFLAGEMLLAHGIDVPAVAGEAGWARLRNPVDSGILITLEALLFTSLASAEVEVRANNTDTAAVSLGTNGGHRDLRWQGAGGIAQPVALIESGSQAFGASGQGPLVDFDYFASSGLWTLMPFAMMIDSGRNVAVQHAGLNSGPHHVTFVWRERAVERGEQRES